MRAPLLAVLFLCAPLLACQQPCGPSTCAGCCNADGDCVEAPNNSVQTICGGAGLACAACASNQLCDPSRLVCIANADASACSSPPVQTFSEPCCSSYGADACGAGLFCAAFDGRTRETCYAEHSRLSLETCTEDRQCTSSSCNTVAGKCRSSQYELCTTQVGCTPTNQYGTPLNCVTTSGQLRCET